MFDNFVIVCVFIRGSHCDKKYDLNNTMNFKFGFLIGTYILLTDNGKYLNLEFLKTAV